MASFNKMINKILCVLIGLCLFTGTIAHSQKLPEHKHWKKKLGNDIYSTLAFIKSVHKKLLGKLRKARRDNNLHGVECYGETLSNIRIQFFKAEKATTQAREAIRLKQADKIQKYRQVLLKIKKVVRKLHKDTSRCQYRRLICPTYIRPTEKDPLHSYRLQHIPEQVLSSSGYSVFTPLSFHMTPLEARRPFCGTSYPRNKCYVPSVFFRSRWALGGGYHSNIFHQSGNALPTQAAPFGYLRPKFVLLVPTQYFGFLSRGFLHTHLPFDSTLKLRSLEGKLILQLDFELKHATIRLKNDFGFGNGMALQAFNSIEQLGFYAPFGLPNGSPGIFHNRSKLQWRYPIHYEHSLNLSYQFSWRLHLDDEHLDQHIHRFDLLYILGDYHANIRFDLHHFAPRFSLSRQDTQNGHSRPIKALLGTTRDLHYKLKLKAQVGAGYTFALGGDPRNVRVDGVVDNYGILIGQVDLIYKPYFGTLKLSITHDFQPSGFSNYIHATFAKLSFLQKKIRGLVHINVAGGWIGYGLPPVLPNGSYQFQGSGQNRRDLILVFDGFYRVDIVPRMDIQLGARVEWRNSNMQMIESAKITSFGYFKVEGFIETEFSFW